MEALPCEDEAIRIALGPGTPFTLSFNGVAATPAGPARRAGDSSRPRACRRQPTVQLSVSTYFDRRFGGVPRRPAHKPAEGIAIVHPKMATPRLTYMSQNDRFVI
jgi:hypothetical protein